MSAVEPIRIWSFDDAPEYLRELSDHGGDEDWVAEVPPWYDHAPFLDSGTTFGCFRVSDHPHPARAGWKVRIGAHA